MCVATTGISHSGLPSPQSGLNADFADLVEISVAACKDAQGGVSRYFVSIDQSHDGIVEHGGMSVTPTDEGWLESTERLAPRRGPVIVSPDAPLVLLRKPTIESGVNGMSRMPGYDALMLWIRRTGPWRGDHTTVNW